MYGRYKTDNVAVVCKRGVPIAEMHPIVTTGAPRRDEPGAMSDWVVYMAEDAFAPMSDEEADELVGGSALFKGDTEAL